MTVSNVWVGNSSPVSFVLHGYLQTQKRDISLQSLLWGKKKIPVSYGPRGSMLQLFSSKSQKSHVIGIPSIQCIDFLFFSVSFPEQCCVYPGSLQISLSFKLPEVVSIEKVYLSQCEQLPPYSPSGHPQIFNIKHRLFVPYTHTLTAEEKLPTPWLGDHCLFSDHILVAKKIFQLF